MNSGKEGVTSISDPENVEILQTPTQVAIVIPTTTGALKVFLEKRDDGTFVGTARMPAGTSGQYTGKAEMHLR